MELPREKFHKPRTRSYRKELWNKCYEFSWLIAKKCAPTHGGFQSVVPDQVRGDWDWPKWVDNDVKAVNEMASEVFSLHQGFIKSMREALKVLTSASIRALCVIKMESVVTFEDWMRLRGLSESSVKKYEGAVSGALSEWAIDGGIMDGPLTSILSYSRFESIAIALRELQIYQERNDRGHNMYNSALNKYAEYLQEGFDSDIDADVEAILFQDCVSDTEKAALLKTRIGQGSFRQKLISLWGGCAVTGYKDASMLVASHIKPWHASTNIERLDGYNGLLLLPTLDKAFDSGLISFAESGSILISPLLQEPEGLGITKSMSVNLKPEHQVYMEFHRDSVFRST
ncbi:HNH endonuclease [Shewanella xiamenensis]|uniref:HNH endonuclease n=1 Tax=Shewanella TaxID=22 RepID=UPI0002F396FB|nr:MULTISPECIES: HNH endonuclease [Shewanella]MCT8857522.1 HNH endonuclease [Shewanella xiamenensis]MDH1627361.1 HNH endonuclease [Shewanella xiamenensis]MDV5248863.1 HNH endonuclease [Shewanella xiamenensis]UWG66461.1 HNH endonuclease [Shewanella xiamenensis]